MKNEIRLRDIYDSIDLAVLSVKLESKYKSDPFSKSIPETFGELRERLLIDRNHPLFADVWKKYVNKQPITCMTSGTTGDRKQITHPFEFWEKHIRAGSANDIWGLAYDPEHIAGIFVILQAFVNNSKIVLLWEHENPSEEIIENGITHISASSTFYRMLTGVYPEVQKVTIGSMRPLDDLNIKFPNATIKNIYATTEHGVISVTNGEWFKLKDNMDVVNDELIVNGKPTGDLVRVCYDLFCLCGRKGEFANVGGEKVYFEYVERIMMLNNSFFDQIKVYSKENSVTGEILVADVVSKDRNREVIFTGLTKAETPIVYYVANIETTENGKVKR
jgi:hypothetical protein